MSTLEDGGGMSKKISKKDMGTIITVTTPDGVLWDLTNKPEIEIIVTNEDGSETKYKGELVNDGREGMITINEYIPRDVEKIRLSYVVTK